MCTPQSATAIMVCDVVKENLVAVLLPAFGPSVTFRTVDGEGTLVTCHAAERTGEFQQALRAVIGEGLTFPAPE